MTIVSCFSMEAQFYDSEDELYFYLIEGTYANPYVYVFNFDGEKAVDLVSVDKSSNSISIVKSRINEKNQNYYEDLVFNATYNMKYDANKSDYNTTVYTRYLPPNYGPGILIIYKFSNDRENLTILNNTKYPQTYKRIPKDYLIEQKGRRSKANSGVIYE